MDREPDERRAMIRVARLATDRGLLATSERAPSAEAVPRPKTILEQSMQAAAGWMYLAPFLCASPFLWSPPFWIAALSQMPERR